MQNNKLLLIGWDAADWQVIEPLMREGKMPALQRMISQGVSGNIATLSPTLSPILWSSIATGKRAYEHGICGFVEQDPVQGDITPVRSTTRKCKAMWNILNEAGLTTNLINWWPSHPAEKLNGVTVSNRFHHAAPPAGEAWPLSKAAIYPSSWYEELKELRLHPAELSLAHVLPFIPEAASLDPEKDPVLKPLLRVLAHCSSVHNATTLLMEKTEWDFMAVYHEAIDHFSHLAMQYHPPKLGEVSDREFKSLPSSDGGGPAVSRYDVGAPIKLGRPSVRCDLAF
ncbi:MAG: alkaline phosphatase family protein [Owenweeksia sp.]|nr:alkaline phosphatase family protein [Owenweeksia sp.]